MVTGHWSLVTERPLSFIGDQNEFPEQKCQNPIQEISLDGGKVRLRTEEKGMPCVWRDYQAICLNKQGYKKL